MKQLARWILATEPLALAVVMLIFWTPDPNRVYSLYLVIPYVVIRFIVYRRIAPASPLNWVMLALIGLGILNLYVAPYRPSAWILGRPLMGIVVAISFADLVKRGGRRTFDALLTASALLGLGIGLVALFWSQWSTKSFAFDSLIRLIPPRPQIGVLDSLFGSGFNVNEIAGALAWLCPLLAGIAILDYRLKQQRVRMALATAGFVILAIALMFGQSRAALFGVFSALVIISFTLIRRTPWRAAALFVIALFTAYEVLLVTGVLYPSSDLQARDEVSVQARPLIWRAALDAILDYPLTGLGMAKFRTAEVRAIYPVPGYQGGGLPHAHNELIHIGTDFGIPGMLVLISLYGVTGWMLWRAYRRGQSIAAAIAAGLIAHAVFGMLDAITLFDRFIFVFWWLIGLSISVETISTEPPRIRSIVDVESESLSGTSEKEPGTALVP